MPLLGVIPHILRHGGPEYLSACTRKYGGVYKVRAMEAYTNYLFEGSHHEGLWG